VRNPETHPYHEGEKEYRITDRKYRNKQKFDEDGEVINSSDEDFEQPSDKDSQGNALSIRRMDIDGEDDINQTPNKEDTQSAVESETQTLPLSEKQERHLIKHDDDTNKIKKLFAIFAAKIQKQLNEQAEIHTIEIAAMKQTSMETQNLLTTKTMTTKPVNDHRAYANFTSTTKACDVLFDGQPKNWPAFEHHLMNEYVNTTIGWNQELVHFQLMDSTTKPFNFLEGYFNIPEIMIEALQEDLNRTKKITW
jgi:hypothetical protein